MLDGSPCKRRGVGRDRTAVNRALVALLRLFGVALYYLRLHPVFIRLGRRFPKVLVYHACEPVESPYVAGLHTNTPPDDLASHLRFLRRYYQLVPLSLLEAGMAPTGSVVVTFDDGYRSVFENAFPLLLEFSVPATIYLVTSTLDDGPLVWVNELAFLLHENHEGRRTATEKLRLPLRAPIAEIVDRARALYDHRLIDTLLDELRATGPKHAGCDRLYLDRAEISEMAHAGITFGSHTATHPNLARMSESEQREELRSSLERLEELPGGHASLAYPFGDHSAATRRLATDLGFRSLMEVGVSSPELDLRSVGRIPVADGNAARLFAEIEFVHPAKSLIRRWARRFGR